MIKTSRKSFLLWSIAALFYLYEMILRASTSVMAESLRQDFGLDGVLLGVLSSSYYWAYTPLQLPCGVILDVMGARRLITLSCLTCALGACLFSLTSHFSTAFCARFLMGAGSACAFVSTLSLIMGWFSRKHFALMAGMTNLMGCVGGVFAGKPIGLLLHQFQWRQVMLGLGLFGFFLAWLTWCIIKDGPPQSQKKEEDQKVYTFLSNVKTVLGQRQIWFLGTLGGLIYLPISTFSELWAIPFITTACQVDRETASSVTLALYMGMGIGSPLMAFWGHRMKSYTAPLKYASWFCCASFLAIALSSQLPFYWVLAFSGLSGLVLGAQMLVFTLAQDHVSHRLSGTASAFTNAIITFIGLIFQPLIGWLLDLFWYLDQGTLVEGIPFYGVATYTKTMMIYPLSFLVGILLLKGIKDTFATHHA